MNEYIYDLEKRWSTLMEYYIMYLKKYSNPI